MSLGLGEGFYLHRGPPVGSLTGRVDESPWHPFNHVTGRGFLCFHHGVQ